MKKYTGIIVVSHGTGGRVDETGKSELKMGQVETARLPSLSAILGELLEKSPTATAQAT